MRASTLFAITIAVLLGLGAAVGVKYAGLFNKPATGVGIHPGQTGIILSGASLFAVLGVAIPIAIVLEFAL